MTVARHVSVSVLTSAVMYKSIDALIVLYINANSPLDIHIELWKHHRTSAILKVNAMDPLSAIGYIAIFIISVVCLYYLGTRSARKLEETFPGLPGPKPWPFISHMPAILKVKGQLHLFLEEEKKKHGRLYSMTFGGSPALVVSDPEMIKDILVKRFDCFHDRSVRTFFVCCHTL